MTTINAIGRITKDFELRTGKESGCVYANFSLAVNEGFGENRKPMYFECVVFGKDAERLVNAKAKKGSLIQVTGKFGTQEFTRTNGEPGYSLKITVLGWSYIPGSNGNGQKNGNDENGGDATDGGNAQFPTDASDVADDYNGETNLDDDDLPL